METITLYLELRRRLWHGLHDIPTDVRKVIGKGRRFCVGRKTSDKSIAEHRAAILDARWRGQIAAARNGSKDPVEADAAYWRSLLDTGPN